MFSVLLDKQDRYTGSYSDQFQLEGGVVVDNLPESMNGDPLQIICFRLDADLHWVLDEELYKARVEERNRQEEEAKKEADRLAAISNEKLDENLKSTMHALTEVFELITSMM